MYINYREIIFSNIDSQRIIEQVIKYYVERVNVLSVHFIVQPGWIPHSTFEVKNTLNNNLLQIKHHMNAWKTFKELAINVTPCRHSNRGCKTLLSIFYKMPYALLCSLAEPPDFAHEIEG